MLCLVASAVVGFMLILSLKSRLIRDGKRRNHRRLGYLWLPSSMVSQWFLSPVVNVLG